MVAESEPLGPGPETTQKISPKPASTPKRNVLVITDHQGWPANGPTVLAWEELSNCGNIRDFDDILFDVSEPPLGVYSPPDAFRGYASPDDRSRKAWGAFEQVFRRDVVDEFLLQGGRLVVAGRAKFRRPSRFFGDFGGAQSDFTGFLGILFDWDEAPGKVYEVLDEAKSRGLADYLTKLEEYEETLVRCWPYVPPSPYGGDPWQVSEESVIAVTKYAVTRGGKAIAFSFSWPKALANRGEVTFLPLPSEGRREAIRQILTCYLGVDLGDDAPTWVNELRVPEEDQIDHQLSKLQTEIAQLRQQSNDLEARRVEARMPLRLLYGSDDDLEEAVRSAFAELGAAVEAPVEKYKEDGWIEVEVGGSKLAGVLEIKSTINAQFGVAGVRQLGEWVQRGLKNRDIQYKPIFVGASLIREPASGRPNPFGSDFIKTAAGFEAALLRSEDLFEALMAHRRGALDVNKFWVTLFDSIGPVDVAVR